VLKPPKINLAAESRRFPEVIERMEKKAYLIMNEKNGETVY
jgi:hypothetical protein